MRRLFAIDGVPIGVVIVLSGLAIWKPVQLALLTDLFGGFVWARYWHFVSMLLLVVAVGLAAVFVFGQQQHGEQIAPVRA